MPRKYIILIVSFFAAIPFWWLVNSISANVESFWFAKSAEKVLSANLGWGSLSQLREINRQKAFQKRMDDLSIDARSFFVLDLDNNFNGKIILEKNPDVSLPIASLSKLMTALIIFELGQTYKDNPEKDELLKKMLVESDNQASDKLAAWIGMDAFIELMDYYARKVGLRNTFFINPSGLDDDKNNRTNLSTAQDLSKLAVYILKKHPRIFEITILNKENGTSAEILRNYSEIIGSKTGWTMMANGCLLEIVKKKDNSGYFINILLGANDRFGEMKKILDAQLQ